VICRCRHVTEAEIVEAIRRPVGARSLDGVKRRVTAGMGRCQGGFCSPKVMAILERELALDPTELTKAGPGSELVVGLREGLEASNAKGGE
jgi:glycerol-3-phosphate dehydrogenase